MFTARFIACAVTILSIFSLVIAQDHSIHMKSTGDTATIKLAVVSKPLAPQTTCPVMSGAINKKSFTDYKGQRIYVCCPGCINQIKADPEKYIKVLADRGEAVEQIASAAKPKADTASVKEPTAKKSHEMKRGCCKM